MTINRVLGKELVALSFLISLISCLQKACSIFFPTKTSTGIMRLAVVVIFLHLESGVAAAAPCKPVPSDYKLPDDIQQRGALPNPFSRVDGSLVTTKEEWACRRKELLELFQRHE